MPLLVLSLGRGGVSLHDLASSLAVPGADWARFVPEHAGVAALMSAGVDQLSLLALVKGHVTTGTGSAARLALQQLSYGGQVCKENEQILMLRWLLGCGGMDVDIFLSFSMQTEWLSLHAWQSIYALTILEAILTKDNDIIRVVRGNELL